MVSRRARKSISLATKSAQLALAAPHVVANRVTRMALAGASPSRRDVTEFNRMISEKPIAFLISWNAMGMQTLRAQQQFMYSWFKAAWMPWLGKEMTQASISTHIQNAAVACALSGLAPFHEAVVANAKRLAFTKLR
jgi:hypothetical protein